MRLTVGRKLIAGSIVVLVLTGVVGWAGLNLARSANDDTRAVYQEEVVGLVDLSRAVAAANEVRRRGLNHVLAEDPQVMRDLEQEGDRFTAEFASELASLKRLWTGQRHKLEALAQVEREWMDYLAERENSLRLSAAGRKGAAEAAVLGPAQEAFLQAEAALDALVEVNEDLAGARLAEAESSFSTGRNTVVAMIVAAIIVGFGIAVALARSIAGSVGRVAAAAQRLTEGDLTRRADVRTRDEIGAMAGAFNAMAERLQGMVEEERRSREVLQSAVGEYATFAAKVSEGDLTVRVSSNGSGELEKLAEHLNGMVNGLGELSIEVLNGSHSIGSAATQILAAVSQHTASATEQSASINEITATIDEIRAAAEQVTEKARNLSDRAKTSVEASDEASASVEAIVEGMTQISERVESIAQGILELSEQTQRIGEITATVDDLADQSNLLALNATIEAARAGEQGKGFAVVADEVRNLADQSKQAAAQVGDILNDIRKGTDTAVMSTEQGTKAVERGVALAHRAGDRIQQLTDVIREAAQAAQQITVSAHQQNVGMDQIAHAMADINQSTTQFVSGAEQSQKAAEDLTDLARQLQGLTERYKV